jgi:hypothetical protein
MLQLIQLVQRCALVETHSKGTGLVGARLNAQV